MDFEPEDLEELLESVLDTVEIHSLRISENVALPARLKWIISDGAYVIKDQILAVLTPSCDGTESVGSRDLMLKSPINGKISLSIENSSLLYDKDVVLAKIEQGNCNHEVLIHGLCAYCSVEVYEENPNNKKRKRENDKIRPGFITNNSAMRIDVTLANDLECNELYKYLTNRKLCLVLDLDNTLLHATSVRHPNDMDVTEIDIMDKSVKNYINTVQYQEDDESLMLQRNLENSVLKTVVYNDSGTTCFKTYTKLRPGVFKFLRECSKLFDLYLFTMGTKQHASTTLSILDPQGLFFNKRVFCRDDSKSYMKSLDRIFPKYKHLILIVDDSELVWTTNINIIRVHPYFFFQDLSHLTTKDYRTLTRSAAALQAPCIYSNFIWSKVMSSTNSSDSTANNTDRESTNINYHNDTFNLSKYNLEDNNNGETTSNSDDSVVLSSSGVKDKDGFNVPPSITSMSKHKTNNVPKGQTDVDFHYCNLFISNKRPSTIFKSRGEGEVFKKISILETDVQLQKVYQLLNQIHSKYFETIDNITDDLTIDLLKDLLDSNKLPNAGVILQDYQRKLLSNVCLYANPFDFTCPKTNRAIDFKYLDYGHYVTKFGAKISDRLNDNVTHYLCNNKTECTYDDLNIKTVHIKWLEAIMYTWEYYNEEEFNVNNWKEPIRSFWDILYNLTTNKP